MTAAVTAALSARSTVLQPVLSLLSPLLTSLTFNTPATNTKNDWIINILYNEVSQERNKKEIG